MLTLCVLTPTSSLCQVFDAGEYFGIMQVDESDEQEEEEEEQENAEVEKKKSNPGDEIVYKVIVTNDSGLQASDPTRWGRFCNAF